MEASNWINLGIFLATLLVGILTWFGARKSAREALESQSEANTAAIRSADAAEKTLEVQEQIRILEETRHTDELIESRSATLSARIDRAKRLNSSGTPSPTRTLIVKNTGQATAHNLIVEVEGISITELPSFMTNSNPNDHKIGPGSDYRVPMVSLFGEGSTKLPCSCKLTWSDDSGEGKVWEGTLS